MFQCLAGLMNKSRNNRKIIQKFSLKSHVKLRHERVFRRKFCLSFHSGAFVSLSQKFLFTFLPSKFLKTIQTIWKKKLNFQKKTIRKDSLLLIQSNSCTYWIKIRSTINWNLGNFSPGKNLLKITFLLRSYWSHLLNNYDEELHRNVDYFHRNKVGELSLFRYILERVLSLSLVIWVAYK